MTKSQELVIQLAKELDVEFPKDKICSDCFYYMPKGCDYFGYEDKLSCSNRNLMIKLPPDEDDIIPTEITRPHLIDDMCEAQTCPYYKSGYAEYKRMYEELEERFEDTRKKMNELLDLRAETIMR